MDIMDYLYLEMPSILLLKISINKKSTLEEIDRINADIGIREEEMLEWCSLANFEQAKGYYEGKLLNHNKKDLFGISISELLDYVEKLISMKKERER